MANLENNNDKENTWSSESSKTEDSKPTPPKKKVKWWAKLLQIVFWAILGLILLVLVAIKLPVTQNWAAQKVMKVLNKELKSQISFKNIDINFFGDVVLDEVVVKDYKNYPFIKAQKLTADSDWFTLISNTRDLNFKGIDLEKMDMKVITYKEDSISNFVRFISLFDNGQPADPKKPPFQFKARIKIGDSKVSIVNQNYDGDQGKWLDATDVNILIPQLKVKGPDISARINNLSFVTERWGKKHFLETFSTDFQLNKKFLSLDDLTIHTDHSLLQGRMKFNLHEGSWADFETKVKMEADFKLGSYFSGYDLSYFVTNWDNYKPLNIAGTLNGPLDDFTLENFSVSNPVASIRTNKLLIQHFLKDNFHVQSDKVSTNFTYVELKEMLPSFIAKSLKNIADDFGRMKFDGSLDVTQKQVYIPNANLLTGIGQAKVSQFFLNDYLTALPKFRGNAELKDFNTSVVSKSKQVGLLTGKFYVDGQSFDVNTMKLRTKSQIAKVEITGKEINNLYLDGTLDHKKYFGTININDEQVQGNVKGLIDFSTPKLKTDIEADIKRLNVNYFTDQKGEQIIFGYAKGKLEMSNINDLVADAEIKGLTFNNGKSKFSLPNSKIKTFFNSGNRVVDVDSPGAINGKIEGKFNLGDLGGLFENAMNKVLIGPEPRKKFSGQHFTMDFEVKQDLVNYFMPEILIPDGAKVTGNYDGNSNNIVLNADAASLKYIMTKTEEPSEADKALALTNPNYKLVPRITKDSAVVENITLRINTANPNEQIFTKVDRIANGNNIFRDVTLSAKNDGKESLHIATNFKMGTKDDEAENKLKDYAINLSQTFDANGDYVFKFEPTTVKFGDVAWSVDASPNLNQSITYRKKTGDFLVQNLRVFSDESELFVKNATFKSAKDFEVDGEVKNLDISKLLVMQSGGNVNNVQGIANGVFQVKMDKSNLVPIVNLNVDKIMMNEQKLGNLILSIQNSDTPNIFDAKLQVVDSGLIGKNTLLATGTIDNNGKVPTLNLSTEMNDFDLAFSNEFVKSVFSNMRGKANGTLKISGPVNDIDYSGDVALHGFGLKLNFTGVDYSMDDTVINLSKGLAILNDIQVHDGRSNSSGSISGAIQFQTLSSMGVNLVMRANNLLVLNTTQRDFDLFWGRVYGRGTLYIDGPVSALNLSTPDMKALNNSTFTFNSGSTSSSSDEFKMLRFVQEDKMGKLLVEKNKNTGANMNVDFNLEVDKGTTVNVIVGDDVGSISVHGSSEKLVFQMNRQGNISMDGAYTVDNGTYTSKVVLERTFQIAKGSTIRWDGDAMTPSLDITANYLRTVTNAGEYLSMGSLPPIKVLLQIKIGGTLNRPDPKFEVSAPDVSSQVKETLASKLSNEDEKVVQFGSVLLMSNFNVSNTGGIDINAGNVLASSGYNLIFKQLSSVLNTISNQFQIDLNFAKGDAAANTGDRASTSFSFSLSPRWTFKGAFGIPLTKNSNLSGNYLTTDGTVEYDDSVNNDNSRVWRFYSKQSNLGLIPGVSGNASANQTYGVGIVWSKSFNTLFKKGEKSKKTDSVKSEIKKDSIKKEPIK